MKRGFADTRHGQIHYITEGSGKPVLLLHKDPTSSWDYALMVPLLGKKYRAIAMDKLGSGDSDQPPRQYDIADYARSVVEFLDTLGIATVSLVGRGVGAGIAAEVAASYPNRVEKLVVVGYPLFPQEMLERWEKGWPAIKHGVEPLVIKEDGSHMLAIMNFIRYDLGPQVSLEDLHGESLAILKSGIRNEEGHLALWRYLDQGGAQKRLALIKCPTLAIFSSKPRTQDDKERFDFAERELKKLIPRIKIIVEGEDAPPPLSPRTKPEQFAQPIIDFLENSVCS